jgi:hypothetical protein
MEEYDEFSGLSRRRYVAPNFAEARAHARLFKRVHNLARVCAALTFLRPCLHFTYARQVRHVLNMAQVRGSAPSLRLITFDADGTLYEDGAHFERDNAMIRKIIALLQAGLHVGVVTAAGYPGEAVRFEGRLKGLLVRPQRTLDRDVCVRCTACACALTRRPSCAQAAFRTVSPELRSRFHVMGGECNYLLRCVGAPRATPLAKHSHVATSANGYYSAMQPRRPACMPACLRVVCAHRHTASARHRPCCSPPPSLHACPPGPDAHLEFVPPEEWQLPEMLVRRVRGLWRLARTPPCVHAYIADMPPPSPHALGVDGG